MLNMGFLLVIKDHLETEGYVWNINFELLSLDV